VILALGVVYQPILGLLMGGIAGPAFVAPPTWGLLFLAMELLILFRAFFQGSRLGLWFLIPIFLLWANVDESFLYGLVVLASGAVGYLLDQNRLDLLRSGPEIGGQDERFSGPDRLAAANPVKPMLVFTVLGICALVCLANPSTWHVYEIAASPFTYVFQKSGSITTIDQLSFFSSELRQQLREDWYLLPAYYLGVVALGLGSFLLNVRRFSWARFLPFAVMAVLWGVLIRANSAFALVFAAVMAINGQEWYQDRFGTQGRMSARWTFWSTGGRLVTLALIFLLMSKDITGWGNSSPDLQFGLGFHPDAFITEAADFLSSHNEIEGNVLNTSLHQGDILIWKASPKRRSFIDGRARLFPHELLEEWHKIRKALSEDDVPTWKPLLDKYQISAVMIEPIDAPLTYQRLFQSPNWVPFYDDGRIVMFGRADAPAKDLAFFKANKLDADLRLYKTMRPVPSSERPPNPTTWIDSVFQNRTSNRPQTRTESARRWLTGAVLEDSQPNRPQITLPDPARCILAIQEARTGLAQSPDDWIAYRILKDAYRTLMLHESAMLAGIPITLDNLERIVSTPPRVDLLGTRVQQRATALNYAIMTTPPPRSRASRIELGTLNYELHEIYLQVGARDLARDRLKALVEMSEPGDLAPEALLQLQQKLSELDKAVKEVDEKIADFEIERSAGPVEKAAMALNQGNMGRAIAELAEAERNSVSTAIVKPRLVDLLCNTGQPERAFELLSTGALDDPNLGAEPGSGSYRQGRVYMLMGNYFSAATLWDKWAIPRVRADRSGRVLAAATGLTRGDAVQTTNSFMAMPGSLRQHAMWLYELALCQLEGGLPEPAGENFTKALTLSPDINIRPIAAYYLEKIGKPVPPPSKRGAAAPGTTTTPSDSLKSNILKTPLVVKPDATEKPAQASPVPAPTETGKEKPQAPASPGAREPAAKKSD
jgi:tetratricopeptide (TPR) repeat protein